MRLCIFDLDHTLVSSPLDLAAMALDMRACLERSLGPLPARSERYRVFELISHCQREAPALEAELWGIALGHERRAVEAAWLEPGAAVAIQGARSAGFGTAVWTNNAREVATLVLGRFDLLPHLDLVVTRDETRALKPDPDGWRVIGERLGDVRDAVVVGDSWVDGLAAAAVGIPFVAYRPRAAELTRWGVKPVATLANLDELPAWLAAWSPDSEPVNESACRAGPGFTPGPANAGGLGVRSGPP
ncbi:MAG: HAD family hydrolase [Candidatus Rokubacteria bacterium]|nr:HAD family hydrolase [Candidatus Rokubacteria bacterium]